MAAITICDFGAQENKVCHCFHPSICHEVMWLGARMFIFWMLSLSQHFHTPLSHSSVQFSRSVMSDSLWPHEPQHTRSPCPSPTPRVHPNPCPLSWWCHPTILSSVIPSPPVLNHSQHQGLFQWVSSLHQVAKVLEFQLQPQSFQWTPGLISFRMDWLDLLTVQGTLKSLLQHHTSKASTLLCSAFFIVQLSHPYMTTGKTIVLTRWTFVGKAMSLLFNMLSRLVRTFLPRSK